MHKAIQLRVSAELKDSLLAEAKRKGLTLSELIRDILENEHVIYAPQGVKPKGK